MYFNDFIKAHAVSLSVLQRRKRKIVPLCHASTGSIEMLTQHNVTNLASIHESAGGGKRGRRTVISKEGFDVAKALKVNHPRSFSC